MFTSMVLSSTTTPGPQTFARMSSRENTTPGLLRSSFRISYSVFVSITPSPSTKHFFMLRSRTKGPVSIRSAASSLLEELFMERLSTLLTLASTSFSEKGFGI